MIHWPTEHAFEQTTAKVAPWWIAIGVTGVAIGAMTGKAPLLLSMTLIGMGSDADLARRLREAMAAESELSRASNPALIAGFVRRIHAVMYGVLFFFAWASLLHLSGQSGESSGMARWWLAGDVAAAALLAIGYARLARRHG